MKAADIAEVIGNAIQNEIFDKWKHEGYVDGMYTNGVRANIDGKKYVIEIKEEKL